MPTHSNDALTPKEFARSEKVFLLLSGLFFGLLGFINLLGVSRFVDWSLTVGHWHWHLVLPIGVLPYPLTFLCTDLISEFFGKKRANFVVLIRLLINVSIGLFLWLSGWLPHPTSTAEGTAQAFEFIRSNAINSITASMLGYLVAQFLDVQLFHYFKQLTQNKHLWLRNNASTLISQLVDTIIVINILYFFSEAIFIPTEATALQHLIHIIFSIYLFKVIMALLDTLPFYLAVKWIRRYLKNNVSAPVQKKPTQYIQAKQIPSYYH